MTDLQEATRVLDLPDTTEAATPVFLTAALRAGRTIPDAVTVARALHEPLGGVPAILGQVGRLRPTYEGDAPSASTGYPSRMVLKLPTTAPSNRAPAAAFRLYEREARFYSDLAPHLSVRTPRCYWAQVAPGGTAGLLLEDLGGWTGGDQLTGASPQDAHRAMAALASLHASRWAAPDLDGIGWLPSLDSPAHLPLGQLYRDAWPFFVEKFGDLLTPAAHELGLAVQRGFEYLTSTATAEAPTALCHGDFRLDNLLFGPDEVAVLDWQSVHRGPAVEDVAMFLTQSLDVETRRRHERDLVRTWYDGVAAGVPGGLSDYPSDLAWTHYRRMALFATVYPAVIGGVLDPGNERSRALFATMAVRSFTAVLDLGAEEFLP